MIKLKQYSAPTVSLEQELSQLESVVIALEAAQTNPEISALLYGHSVSLESFGDKVKDTAKKVWEAILALLKKLFNWGKSTEEKVVKVLEKTKETVGDSPDLSDVIQSQHRKVEGAVQKVSAFEQLPNALTTILTECPDLPSNKLKALVTAHYRYYGNVMFKKNLDDMFQDLNSSVIRYNTDRDSVKLKKVLLDISDHILDGSIPNGVVDLHEISGQISELVKKYATNKIPFSFDKSAFQVNLENLRSDLEGQKKVLSSWNNTLEIFQSNFHYAEKEGMLEEKWNFKLVINLSKVMVDYISCNVDYLLAAYEYRKHFEE